MANTKIIIIAIICVALTNLEAQGCLNRPEDDKCKRRGKFTYNIHNVLEEPYFSESTELCITRGTKFITYMEKAVLLEPTKFVNFTATFSSPYGYFINSINNVAGRWHVDGTFWIFLDTDKKPLPVGVSTYEPKHDDVITLNFTNFWPEPDPDV